MVYFVRDSKYSLESDGKFGGRESREEETQESRESRERRMRRRRLVEGTKGGEGEEKIHRMVEICCGGSGLS